MPMRFLASSKHDRHCTLSPVFTAISPPSAPWRASIATYRLCKQLASPVHRAPSPSGVRASRITCLSHANAIPRVFKARSTPHSFASVHRHLATIGAVARFHRYISPLQAASIACEPCPIVIRCQDISRSRITRLSHANAILRVFRARSTPHRIASAHRHLLPPSTLWCAFIALVASDCLSPSPAPCKAPHCRMVPRLL